MNTAAPLAIVTGASSGIGKETAIALAARGYRTLLIARRADRIAALAGELNARAPSHALALDLCDSVATEVGATEFVRHHGPVDVLVNNAGFGMYQRFIDTPPEEVRRLMEVHYFAALAMIRAVLPAMLERRRGHVINVASISTKMSPWGHSAYTAAKCALVALTQSLAGEHEGSGVHFSYVNPGIVRTEFFDDAAIAPVMSQNQKRAIPAARVAAGIVGLLDRPRLELCVPRVYRAMDWIKAISPGFALRLVTKNSRPATGTAESP